MPYFAAPRFYTGYGWYRKHFDIPAEWSGKRIFLEFDGAFQDAEIFIDGKRIAEHKGGYTGFSLDITDAVKVGDNLVAVRLNNLWNAQLAPRAGEHVFSGGIYRDVRLVVTEPLHVIWYGTFVTTPEVSAESGTVNVKTEIRNDSAAAKECVLQTDILDPTGKKVASVSTTQTVPAGATVMFDQTTAPISRPKLWHPDHPFLYTAMSKISDGKKIADNFQTPFGFRWLKWTADQGFFINGEHLYFKGKRASGSRGLGRRGGRQRIFSRRENGQGSRLRFHSRLALSARPGVRGGVRRAGSFVLVRELFLGHGRPRG